MGRHARREPGADEGAHAGAADDVHRHAVFVEPLEDADVGEAAGPAAAEGEADARAREQGLLRHVRRDLGRCRRRQAGCQQERHDPRRARAAAQEFDHSQLFRLQSTAERVQSWP